MRKKITSILRLLLVMIITFLHTNAKAQLLAVSGKKIINTSTNQEVILNAMNFGNWMVMEGYMMNSTSQATAQHIWKKKLSDLIGPVNTTTFYNTWLANHVTQADILEIKKWGFNAVRLPLHYEYFVNLGTPDVWNEQGFTILDNILSWCAAAQIYAIIDLHAAPGGQSNNDISDYDNTKHSLWESEDNKTKTVNLWKRLSDRYKNEPWVAGYDLINEPAWDLPNGTDLKNLYGRLTDVVRTNNDNHILFIEGNWYSNDYTGLTPAWDPNMVYVFHKYWSDATTQDIKWITDFREAQNRPIWCGEHGENSNDHFTKIVETFKANGIGFSWWPMKKFESVNDFADAKYPTGYNDLLNYLGGSNSNLSPATAIEILNRLAENVKLENCKVQTEVLRSIFTQPGNRDTEPFTNNPIPGRVYTPNYDKGMNGFAYSDQAWENVRLTTNTYTAWNNGWVFRNNGVDLEATSDPFSNGYTVGWFNKGEWLKYTVDVATAGTYTIEIRVANGNSSNGTLQIQNANGTEILATATVPPTGGWGNWNTIVVTGAIHKTGSQGIRMVNTLGEYNVNSINFVFQSATLPAVIPVVPSQKVISLKGNNGQYVTFSGTNNLLTCASLSQGANEEFIVVDAGNGLTALKGKNGRYVSVNSSNNLLYCSATQIGLNEKFTMTDLSGALSFKGYNNLYVSSANGATTGMPCDRSTAQAWEYFNWTYLKDVDIVICGEPSSLATSAITTSSAKLSWTGLQNALSYSVGYRISGTSEWTVLSAQSSIQLDLTGLTPGTSYDWRIAVNCNEGTGPFVQSTFKTAIVCNPPAGLNSGTPATTSTTLRWNAVTGAASYDVDILPNGGVWTSKAKGLTTTSYNLTGLTHSTGYTWRVRSNCGSLSGFSGYSQASFTTAIQPCRDTYESNNTISSAKSISRLTNIKALISTETDVDHFKISMGSTRSKIKVTLSNLPAAYNVQIMNSRGAVLQTGESGLAQAGGTRIVYFNGTQTSQTYYIKVFGVSGAFNSSSCYNLYVENGNTNYTTPSTTAFVPKALNSDPVLERIDFKVYPIPAKKMINVVYPSTMDQTVSLRIVNASGASVRLIKYNALKGINNWQVHLYGLNKSIYYLVITDATGTSIQKQILVD